MTPSTPLPQPPINTDLAPPVGTSPFANYLASARNGQISIGSDVAKQCATNVATMIAVVQEVQSYIDTVQPRSGFGPHSGGRLAAKFAKAGSQLGDVLNGHIKLLTDMADTFLAAGKLYNDSESDNATMFNSILTAGFVDMMKNPALNGSAPSTTADAMPSWGNGPTLPSDAYEYVKPTTIVAMETSDPTAPPAFTSADGYGGLAKVQKASTGKNTTPVDPENPYGQPPSFFDSVHADIDSNAAGNASIMWTWMMRKLNTGSGELHQQLQSVYNSGAWQGDGADSAGKATVAYNSTVSNLTGNMNIIAGNLSYTAGWLNETKVALTPQLGATTAQEQQNYAQNVQAPNFHRIYVSGITNSSSAIPLLVSPIVPPAPTDPAGTGGAGAGPGGSGGLAGGTGASSGGGGDGGGVSGGTGDGGSGGTGSSGGGGGSGAGSGTGTGVGTSTGTDTDTGSGSGSGTATGSGGGTGASAAAGVVGTGTGSSVGAGSTGATDPWTGAAEDESGLAAEEAGGAPGEAALEGDAAAMSGDGALAGGAAARLAGAAGAAAEAEQDLRLFPRAAMSAEAAEASAVARSGSGAAAGEEGESEGSGAGTGKDNKDEEEDEYTRPDYLRSKRYLDEAIGAGYGVSKPVLTP